MKKQNRLEKINEITKQPSWESRRDFITYPSKIVHECNGQKILNNFCLCKLAVPKPSTEFYLKKAFLIAEMCCGTAWLWRSGN